MNNKVSSERWLRPLQMAAVSTLAAAVFFTGLPASAIHAEAPVVSYSGWSASPIHAPILKPLWTAPTDKNSLATVTDDGIALLFSGKKLTAVNVSNGKKLYQYGSNLKPIVQYAKGTVYGTTEAGNVYALNAKTGKQLWQTAANLTDQSPPVIFGDTVYVTKSNATLALEASTGKVRWKTVEPSAEYNGSVVMEADGIVYVTFMVQGALTSIQLDAFDKKTGKKLWGHFRQNAPLAVRDGLVYSVTDPIPFSDTDEGRSVTINAINAKTGDIKGERVYSWKMSSPAPYSTNTYNSVLLDGNDLYMTTDTAVLKYDFKAYQKDGKPLQKWNKPDADASLIGSTHNGKLFFVNQSTNKVLAMKLANGQKVEWITDNPAAQTDIYGNGVYIGQSDGVFHGYNLQTSEPAFTVQTGSRYYGPTLRSGNVLLIQAEDAGKIIAVSVPKALQ